MDAQDKKPGIGFWTAVVYSVLLAYLASFGPACRLSEIGLFSSHAVWMAYRPVTWLWYVSPRPISHGINAWANVFRRADQDYLPVPAPLILEAEAQTGWPVFAGK